MSGAISSDRLDLVPLEAPVLRAILAGENALARRLSGLALPPQWPGDDAPAFQMRAGQVETDTAFLPWSIRALVVRDSGLVAGHAGFHGPPGINALGEAGAVELGYTVELAERRKGFASEAAVALMDWARCEAPVRRFLLSIDPSNGPSLALAARLGFVYIQTVRDEEGEERVYALAVERLPSAASSGS